MGPFEFASAARMLRQAGEQQLELMRKLGRYREVDRLSGKEQ
jgi:hypothetical protein